MFDIYQLFFGVWVFGAEIVGILFKKIQSEPVNHPKAEKIAHAIYSGAMTFLKEEYKVIAYVITIFGVTIWLKLGAIQAGLFALGALFSMITGYIGMRAATMANVRTAMAAQRSGEHAAFLISFFGGGVMGFAVATFGLFGISFVLYMFSEYEIIDSFQFRREFSCFFCPCWWRNFY